MGPLRSSNLQAQPSSLNSIKSKLNYKEHYRFDKLNLAASESSLRVRLDCVSPSLCDFGSGWRPKFLSSLPLKVGDSTLEAKFSGMSPPRVTLCTDLLLLHCEVYTVRPSAGEKIYQSESLNLTCQRLCPHVERIK